MDKLEVQSRDKMQVQSQRAKMSSDRKERESIDETQDFDDNSSIGDAQGLGDAKSTTPSTTGGVCGKQVQTMKKFIGLDDICNNKRLWRMLTAETIGTFLLVFIGCGSCIDWREKIPAADGSNATVPKSYEPNETNGQIVHIALTFGIAVATIAQALGHVSGAHLNPAVSCGLLAAGQCSFLKAVVYIIAQCVGALCGAAVLRLLTPDEFQQGGIGVTGISPSVTLGAGLSMEMIITFVLVLTVCGVCDGLRRDVKGSAPLAIGLSITVCHFMAIRFTGSSMNPARSLGPAVVWGNMKNQWVYWMGPVLGGISAGLIYQTTFQVKPEDLPAPDVVSKGKTQEA